MKLSEGESEPGEMALIQKAYELDHILPNKQESMKEMLLDDIESVPGLHENIVYFILLIIVDDL